MINLLDNMLRTLLVDRLTEINQPAQVSFRPPDEDWRNEVTNLQEMALNVYMVDIRENRKLRSNYREPSGVVDGEVLFTPAPARVDCHYLITAWSPAQSNPAVEPTADEHALLYATMAVLMEFNPLNAVTVYGPGDPILPLLPDLFKTDLPMQVLPVDGFIKQPEFWGTMGENHRWRPAIYLIVTLPLGMPTRSAGPQVTTREAAFGRSNVPGELTGEPEFLYQIGGMVLDATAAPPVPVAGAWVRLLDALGQASQVTRSDTAGRYSFNRVPPNDYQLEARATGFAVPPARPITVPSGSGEYDLTLT